MKLELGMYCYNKINRKSGIGEIVGFRENNNAIIKYIGGISILSIGNIEASHNAIDLIEPGDYVNGYPVVDFDLIYFNGVDRLEEPKRVSIIVDRNSNMGFSETYFKNKDIKSIVTKEQFNSMKYEVGE